MWAFLPNKQLADDDTTKEAQTQLKILMVKKIQEFDCPPSTQELFIAMQEDETFDSQLFWRFNLNRLNQLLKAHYIENPELSTIQDIHKSCR